MDMARSYSAASIKMGMDKKYSMGLMMGENQWIGRFSGNNMESILSTLIDNVTTSLATRFAVVTTNTIQNNVTLKVMGIKKQTDFAQLRYLNHSTWLQMLAL